MSGRHVLFNLPLPTGWTIRSVESIRSSEPHSCVAGPFGSNISSKYFVEDGVPIIRGSNLTDDLTRFVPSGFAFVSHEQAKKYKAQHVRANDLVFTCWGTVGQVGLIPRDGPYPEYIISNKQLKLRPNTNVADPEYLFYYFASPPMVAHIRGRAIGAAVPGINLGILKALEVVLPPLKTQRDIAYVLSAYDDLIENNSRRIVILEEMTKRLYEEWFVHFRFPGHEQLKMIKSELGSIPDGWSVQRLEDAAFVTMGQSPSSEHYNIEGKGLPFHQGVTDFGAHYPFHRMYCSIDGRMAKEGDILMSVRAPVGRINVAPSEMVIGRGLCAIRSKNGRQWFLLNRLLEKFREEDCMGNGAIFKAVTKQEVLGIVFPKAPDTLEEEFERLIAPMWELIKALSHKNQKLKVARDLLLPNLLSGEVDVSALPEPEMSLVA